MLNKYGFVKPPAEMLKIRTVELMKYKLLGADQTTLGQAEGNVEFWQWIVEGERLAEEQSKRASQGHGAPAGESEARQDDAAGL